MNESWIQQMIGWIVAGVIGLGAMAKWIHERLTARYEDRGANDRVRKSNTQRLDDHENRIRALEQNQADMRSDMSEIKTDVKWVKRYLQERNGK